MKYRTNKTGITLICFVALVLTTTFSFRELKAQSDRSMYFLPIVPQKHTINPAYAPDYKFYIGLPFLSSIKTSFENTLKYDDIFKEKGDSLYLDRDYIIGKLKDKNSLNYNLMEEYLIFGFKVGKNYFHARVADLVNANVTISKGLIELVLYGNGHENFIGKKIDMSGNALNLTYYREYQIGYSRQINDKLTVGTNLKYLQGIASVYTEKSDFTLQTDPTDFTFTATSNFVINTSSPWRGEGEAKPESLSPNSNNPGFAIDLGGEYIVDDKIEVSASILNLGSINWKSDTKNYATEDPSNEIVFSGFDISEYFTQGELNQSQINKVLDSIKDEFGIVENTEKYKTPLPTYLNIAGTYHLTKHDHFGLLFRHQFLKNLGWTTATLGYTRSFGKNVNLCLTNTIIESSFVNPGVGFAANLGPVQLYMLTENIIAPINLKTTKLFVFRFGVNLVFGKKQQQNVENSGDDVIIPDQGAPVIQE